MNTKNPVDKKPFRRACIPLALTALLPLSTMAMPPDPLFIEAENYNPGGEGVGYHDLDNRNRGNYDNGRGETVGLSRVGAEASTSDGPATVSYVRAGEWLAYDINVPEAGTYQFEIRSARAPAGEGRIHLEVDGVDVSGPLTIASTGKPYIYQTFSFPDIDLPAGAQQLRLVFDSAGTNTNWFRLSLAQPEAPGNTAPTIINPGAQTHTEGSSVNVLIEANDDDGDSLTYSASGLPAQLSMNSGTGRIRGTVTGAGNHPVIITVDDSNGGTATARFDWVVNETPVLDHPLDWSAEIAARVSAGGTVRTANNAATFNNVVSASSSGDVVLLLDGTYGGGTNYNINKDGLLITAQNLGGVTIQNGARLTITGDGNTIGGFNFNNLNQISAVDFNGASNNRFTDNRFVNSGPPNSPNSRMILVTNGSNGNRIDNNDFAGNRAFGLSIDQPGSSGATSYSLDNRIDHNVFRDILDTGVRGRVPIQLGNGDLLLQDTGTLVDNNEFRDLAIRGSIINSKSSGVTYLNNRFINIPRGHLSLRSGDNNWVEGNYFENTLRGVTVRSLNQTVINNVIINPREAGILIANWGRARTASGFLFYERTQNVLIANNTIVGSRNSAIEIGRNWGFGGGANRPTEDVRIINNIFHASVGDLIDLKTTQTRLTIRNNLYYATGSAINGNIGMDSRAIVGNPNLTPTYELSTGSALAIDEGVTLPEVTNDFDSNVRTGANDVGAYEFGSQ